MIQGRQPRPAGRLRAEGRRLLDDDGREVLLRGVNAGLKAPPFLPPHTSGDVASLVRATGVNLVRLYVAWRAIEPEPHRHDEEHLDDLAAAAARWTAAGVHVVVDVHQDVWGGPLMPHGAPDWATLAADAVALPGRSRLPWQIGYIDPRCTGSFESFWRNARVPATGVGVQAHLVRTWGCVASRLAGEPGVIGFDLLNEPFLGRELRSAILPILAAAAPPVLAAVAAMAGTARRANVPARAAFASALVDRLGSPGSYRRLLAALEPACRRFQSRLARFHARAGREIRRHAPEALLFLEPPGPANVGVPCRLPRDDLPGIVYAPHLYDPFVDSGLPYDGDVRRVSHTLRELRRTADRRQVPLLLGEWGNLGLSAGDPVRFARDVGRLLDEARVGWAYWEHTPGLERDRTFQEVTRPFPRRVAGRTESFRFDPETRTFSLRFTPDPRVREPTVIAVPSVAYPDGPRVTVSASDGRHEHVRERGAVLIRTRSEEPATITLRPRGRGP